MYSSRFRSASLSTETSTRLISRPRRSPPEPENGTTETNRSRLSACFAFEGDRRIFDQRVPFRRALREHRRKDFGDSLAAEHDRRLADEAGGLRVHQRDAQVGIDHQRGFGQAVERVADEAPHVAHAGRGAPHFLDARFELIRQRALLPARHGRGERQQLGLARSRGEFLVHVALRGLEPAPAPHRVADREAEHRRRGREPPACEEHEQERGGEYANDRQRRDQQAAPRRKAQVHRHQREHEQCGYEDLRCEGCDRDESGAAQARRHVGRQLHSRHRAAVA